MLHVAVASRRPLALHVARSRAAGRLTELTAADLAFDGEECAELLRQRTGADPSTERVEEMMRLTEGWPLGIALAAGLVERAAEAGDVATALGDLRSAPNLRSYLSEELVGLARAGASPRGHQVERGPGGDAGGRAGARPARRNSARGWRRAGLLVRTVDDGRGFVYHPLLREFLLDVLQSRGAARPSSPPCTPRSRPRSTRRATRSERSSTGSRAALARGGRGDRARGTGARQDGSGADPGLARPAPRGGARISDDACARGTAPLAGR